MDLADPIFFTLGFIAGSGATAAAMSWLMGKQSSFWKDLYDNERKRGDGLARSSIIGIPGTYTGHEPSGLRDNTGKVPDTDGP